jgi:hypothetical protein
MEGPDEIMSGARARAGVPRILRDAGIADVAVNPSFMSADGRDLLLISLRISATVSWTRAW